MISMPPFWAPHAVLVGWAGNPAICFTGLVIAMYHEGHEVNTMINFECHIGALTGNLNVGTVADCALRMKSVSSLNPHSYEVRPLPCCLTVESCPHSIKEVDRMAY